MVKFFLRLAGMMLLGLAALITFPIMGAVGGWYGGFYLMGVPEGEGICGLAVLPAIVAGGLGAFVGCIGGVVVGMGIFEMILEQESFEPSEE